MPCCILALRLGEPRWRLRSRSGKRVRLCCGENLGAAKARWRPAATTSGGGEHLAGWAESSGRDEAWSSAAVSGEERHGADRLSGGYEKIPSIGLVVWTVMLSLWCNGKRCHRMIPNHQMNGGKSAIFISKCWLPCLRTTCVDLAKYLMCSSRTLLIKHNLFYKSDSVKDSKWFSFWCLIYIIDKNGNSSYIRLL